MKLVNISSKVINIGTKILLPDKSTDVDELTPGIKAIIKAGHLKIDNSEELAKKAAEEAAKKAAEEAAMKAEEAKKKAAEEAAKKAAEEAAKKGDTKA